MSALLPRPCRTYYNAAKAGLNAWFYSLAMEQKQNGVSITIGLPGSFQQQNKVIVIGFVKTEMTTGASRIDGSGNTIAQATSPTTSTFRIPLGTPQCCAESFLSALVAKKRRVAYPAWYDIFVVVWNVFPALYEAAVGSKSEYKRSQ